MPNSISVMAASERLGGEGHAMRNIPSFYSIKLAYGPEVVSAIQRGMAPIALEDPLKETVAKVAEALGKRVSEVVVMTMNRPRHAELIKEVREIGAALRLITDGDITAAVSPSLPDTGVDLYYGIGGSPEGILTAAALKALGGEMLLRMWPRDEEERRSVLEEVGAGGTGARLPLRRSRLRQQLDLLRDRDQRQPAPPRREAHRQKGDHHLDPDARPQPHGALHPRHPRSGAKDHPPAQRPERSEH